MDRVEKVIRKIKERREEKNLRLEDVVTKLEKQGVDITISGLHRIEKGGRQKLDASLLVGLSNVLDYNFFEILGWKGPKAKIVNAAENVISLPLYGLVSAGSGILNFDEEISEIILPKINGKVSQNSFCTVVKGDSMIPFFKDGDIIVVNPDLCVDVQALNKKECVVDFKGERYLKKLIFEKGDLILRSYNEAFIDIIIPNDKLNEVKCCGLVTMVLDMRV